RMLTVEYKVGQFVFVRMAAPVVLADVGPFEHELANALRQLAQRRLRMVACVDLLGATVFPPPVPAAFIPPMRPGNPMLERTGFLIGPAAVFALQMERMLKESNPPMRRAFRDPQQLIAWLGEALRAEEMAHLRSALRLT